MEPSSSNKQADLKKQINSEKQIAGGIQLIPRDDVAWLEWDLPGEKVNKLSSSVMACFRQLLEELKVSNYKAVVLISRKKNIFVAGADIGEMQTIHTAEEYSRVIESGQEIMNLLEDLPMPTVAAIDGACLGGGCELVLACDYRIVTDSPSMKIGLPEVRLGLIPGWGGCVRLPRVVGLQSALDVILAGKTLPGKKAVKMGLVDECVPKEILEQRVQLFIDDILTGKKGKRFKRFSPRNIMDRLMESFLGQRLVFREVKKTVLKMTKGFYPAPLKALEVIKSTYNLRGLQNRKRALEVERKAFCQVAVTDISEYLIQLFFLTEGAKRETGVSSGKKVETSTVNYVGVLGAGVMGGGIAYLAADKGYSTRMKDIQHESVALGLKSAHGIWSKKLQRRRITNHELNRKMSLISGGIDFSGFQQMDVVIEAVVEDIKVKKMVISEAASHCPGDCIMATNTSSLSVTELAKAHPHPENFLGMHFFNPVDKMPLVEVIRGVETCDQATATIVHLSKKMGKTPVVVKDSPGFLVNRLLLPWLLEGMFLLEEGMSIEVVDKFLSEDFGMPMGPFQLLDIVGLDTSMKALKVFKSSMGERMEEPKFGEVLIQSGRLGKKGSKGFYLYDGKGKEASVDPSIYSDLQLDSPADPMTCEECIQRCNFQMINEAARALYEDEVVAKPEDVDLATIMGLGFPPFRGGLLKYADSLGSQKVVEGLEEYASRWGQRFQPCQSLIDMAGKGSGFYRSGS